MSTAGKWPEVWPGYETVGRLGRGGYGTVWKVRKADASGEYYSAVKKISVPASEEEYSALQESGYGEEEITTIFKTRLDKIEEEFRLMEEFQGDSHIVSYQEHMEVEHEDGLGWDILIKMELLKPLARCYDSFSEKEIIRLGIHMCTALETIERRGIVHRDIKPSNILKNEKLGYYKLSDFGIAKTMDHVTKGTMIGTADYIAPEVYNKEAYGFQADQYSLGLVLYWALNKRKLPFVPLDHIPTDDELQGAKQKRVNGATLPAPLYGSEELKAAVLKACAFEPAERYPDISSFKRALYKCEETADGTLFTELDKLPAAASAADDEDDVSIGRFDIVSSKPGSDDLPKPMEQIPAVHTDRTGAKDHVASDDDSVPDLYDNDDDDGTMGRFGKVSRDRQKQEEESLKKKEENNTPMTPVKPEANAPADEGRASDRVKSDGPPPVPKRKKPYQDPDKKKRAITAAVAAGICILLAVLLLRFISSPKKITDYASFAAMEEGSFSMETYFQDLSDFMTYTEGSAYFYTWNPDIKGCHFIYEHLPKETYEELAAIPNGSKVLVDGIKKKYKDGSYSLQALKVEVLDTKDLRSVHNEALVADLDEIAGADKTDQDYRFNGRYCALFDLTVAERVDGQPLSGWRFEPSNTGDTDSSAYLTVTTEKDKYTLCVSSVFDPDGALHTAVQALNTGDKIDVCGYIGFSDSYNGYDNGITVTVMDLLPAGKSSSDVKLSKNADSGEISILAAGFNASEGSVPADLADRFTEGITKHDFNIVYTYRSNNENNDVCNGVRLAAKELASVGITVNTTELDTGDYMESTNSIMAAAASGKLADADALLTDMAYNAAQALRNMEADCLLMSADAFSTDAYNTYPNSVSNTAGPIEAANKDAKMLDLIGAKKVLILARESDTIHAQILQAELENKDIEAYIWTSDQFLMDGETLYTWLESDGQLETKDTIFFETSALCQNISDFISEVRAMHPNVQLTGRQNVYYSLMDDPFSCDSMIAAVEWSPRRDSTIAQAFNESYLNEYGKMPSGTAAYSYDAVYELVLAAQHAGFTDGKEYSADEWKAAFKSLETEGILGTTCWTDAEPYRVWPVVISEIGEWLPYHK